MITSGWPNYHMVHKMSYNVEVTSLLKTFGVARRNKKQGFLSYCHFIYTSMLQVSMSLESISGGAILGVFSLGLLCPWANTKVSTCLKNFVSHGYLDVL